MRITTVIKHLGLQDKLDADDLKIVNSLLKDKTSESKKYDKKILIDSLALLYYAMTTKDRVVLYLSPKVDDSLFIKNTIEVLIKNSKFPKKTKDTMFLKDRCTSNKLVFSNGTFIVFGKTSKRAAVGYTVHWLLVNDIRLTEPGIYETIFKNLYPVMNASRDSRMTLSA